MNPLQLTDGNRKTHLKETYRIWNSGCISRRCPHTDSNATIFLDTLPKWCADCLLVHIKHRMRFYESASAEKVQGVKCFLFQQMQGSHPCNVLRVVGSAPRRKGTLTQFLQRERAMEGLWVWVCIWAFLSMWEHIWACVGICPHMCENERVRVYKEWVIHGRGQGMMYLCCSSGIHPLFENIFIRLSSVGDLTYVCVYERLCMTYSMCGWMTLVLKQVVEC